MNGESKSIEEQPHILAPSASTPHCYMPTTNTAMTRSSDLVTTTDLNWLNPNEGTSVLDAAFIGVSGGGAFAFSLDDDVNDGIGIYKSTAADS